VARIRKSLREEEIRVRKLTDQIFRDSMDKVWVPEGATLTIREEELLFQISWEHKESFVIYHDESATAKTVYIDPLNRWKPTTRFRLLNADRRESSKNIKGVDFIAPR